MRRFSLLNLLAANTLLAAFVTILGCADGREDVAAMNAGSSVRPLELGVPEEERRSDYCFYEITNKDNRRYEEEMDKYINLLQEITLQYEKGDLLLPPIGRSNIIWAAKECSGDGFSQLVSEYDFRIDKSSYSKYQDAFFRASNVGERSNTDDIDHLYFEGCDVINLISMAKSKIMHNLQQYVYILHYSIFIEEDGSRIAISFKIPPSEKRKNLIFFFSKHVCELESVSEAP